MIGYIFQDQSPAWMGTLGILFAFFVTCILLKKCSQYLPKDMGREFAHDGKLSAGKPRGTGFLFILVFLIATLIFGEFSIELVIYLILTAAAMITGFLDDCAKNPWGEYKKGLLDLMIAVMTAVTYLNFNGNELVFPLAGVQMEIPIWLFGLGIVVLVWTSINVTNCADGVDGLSGTLTMITLATIYLLDKILQVRADFPYIILIFMVCILGYLWYNATPSKMLMGDAGSRAMGLFIAIAVLKSGAPFFYILAAFVLAVDGGIGLVKIFLLRFLKIRILTNVRTPLHDYVRKQLGWSNTQTVFRFAIIQIMISFSAIYLLL